MTALKTVSLATSAGRLAALALVALTFGCEHSTSTYNPGCGRLSAPDHDNDPSHCGGCGIVCAPVGAVPACVEGVCDIAECLPDFFDVDGEPSNGCECRGASEDACTLCLAYDDPGDGRDGDCDGRVDESTVTASSSVIPLSRAHCGAAGASCLLAPRAEAVECALSWCNARDFAEGECGHGNGHTICAWVASANRYDCGTCLPIYPEAAVSKVETPELCFDALDNDGNGIADDGPYCEVLLANARTSACSGAAPSEDCPAYHLEIPTNDPRVPTLEVAFTYDVLIDRYEVTRQQFAAHLTAIGWCNGEERSVIHPGCRVALGEGLLPAVDMSWDEALDYCVARGKRLPTYAEFARAALADFAEAGDPVDTQSRPADAVCEAVPVPVIEACGADGVVDANTRGGDAFVGSRHRPAAWLSATAIHHLADNVSEWMLDRYVDWCAASRAEYPELERLACPAESEPGRAWQRGPLVDLVVGRDSGEWSAVVYERLVMGGAYTGPVDAWRLEHRAASSSGLSYLGFRCARTLVAPSNSDPISPTSRRP